MTGTWETPACGCIAASACGWVRSPVGSLRGLLVCGVCPRCQLCPVPHLIPSCGFPGPRVPFEPGSHPGQGKAYGGWGGAPGAAPLPVGGWPGSPVLASPLQSRHLPPSPRGESWSWDQPWSLLCLLGGWVSPAPLMSPSREAVWLGLVWLAPVLGAARPAPATPPPAWAYPLPRPLPGGQHQPPITARTPHLFLGQLRPGTLGQGVDLGT